MRILMFSILLVSLFSCKEEECLVCVARNFKEEILMEGEECGGRNDLVLKMDSIINYYESLDTMNTVECIIY